MTARRKRNSPAIMLAQGFQAWRVSTSSARTRAPPARERDLGLSADHVANMRHAGAGSGIEWRRRNWRVYITKRGLSGPRRSGTRLVRSKHGMTNLKNGKNKRGKADETDTDAMGCGEGPVSSQPVLAGWDGWACLKA